MKDNHTLEAGRIDQPVAALLKDLKHRGMLEDTVVLFTTEFGAYHLLSRPPIRSDRAAITIVMDSVAGWTGQMKVATGFELRNFLLDNRFERLPFFVP